MSALACTLVPGLSVTAEARSLQDKLRSCLELKDMTKQRVEPKPMPLVTAPASASGA